MTKKTDKTTELENQLKRALADYDNLKKRLEKERTEIVQFANEALMLRVLGIVDGLEITLGQFWQLLKEEGVEEIKVKAGDKFDPEVMEAVGGQGEKVEQILSRGYKLHGRVIRPARVKLGK